MAMCGANELVLSRKLSTWPNRPPVLWGEEEREGLRTGAGSQGPTTPDAGRWREQGQRGAVQAEVRQGTSILRVASVWGVDKTPLRTVGYQIFGQECGEWEAWSQAPGGRPLIPPPQVTLRVALHISEGLSGPPFL